jgi:cytosine/adenosine deaminase-related metal-dependent hydrolase
VKKMLADVVFPVSSPPISKGMLVCSDDGMVLALLHPGDVGYDLSEAAYYRGWIVPGFVNAHCHLELSHLKDQIQTGTGLDGFVEKLMDIRQNDPDTIARAILNADAEMYDTGTVFVGDISNGTNSFQCKENSKILYHTFVERFGFHSDKADSAYHSGKQVLEKLQQLQHNHRGNLTLHAPYSVSEKLLTLVCNEISQHGGILSIHNQETSTERDLFLSGKGALTSRLEKMGIYDGNWSAPGISSLQWLHEKIPDSIRVLLVHNTFTELSDLQGWLNRDAWLCLCPGANLYIESRLPDIQLFIDEKLRLVIGTDSLASNTQLNIYEEIKLIALNFPDIPAAMLFEWACLNGAKLFEMQHLLGSFDVGKKPGLVWISDADPEGKKIFKHSKAQSI